MFISVYIYVWKLNQTVLELDFRAIYILNGLHTLSKHLMEIQEIHFHF
jgi:hypothetical protein